MKRFWTALCVLILAGPAWGAGTITGLTFDPPTGCVNRELVATVEGTGTCDHIRINFDFLGSGTPQTIHNVTLPLQVPHTYTTGGNKTVRVISNDPACLGDAQADLDVKTICIDLGEFDEMYEVVLPEITAGIGLVQPGNPFLVLVLGRGFGSQPGNLFLELDTLTVGLTVVDWGANGGFAAFRMPEELCGVLDQTATLKLVTASGWSSNDWPVQFVARREVVPVPRDKASIVSCSEDSNKDCCNHWCDPDDGDWFATCGGWGGTETICGFHYNVWLAAGDDSGTDRFRVDLRPSLWVIEDWHFYVGVDPGEGWAQLLPSNAVQEKVADFDVNWLVTQNDSVSYTLTVMMSGPCGTSPDLAYNRAILDDAMRAIEMEARMLGRGRAAWGALQEAQKKLDAEARQAALVEDRKTQARLVRLREAVTEASIAEAKEVDERQRRLRDLYRRAAAPGADREQILKKLEEMKARAPTPERRTARRPRE